MGWQPGSLVALRDRNQVPVSYEVLLVSDASGYTPSETAWAVTAPHWLRTDFCVPPECVQFVTLRLQAGADPGIVNGRLRQLEPALIKFKSGDEIRDYHLRDVDRDFYLFDLLLLLVLGLAGTGLLNGMTISALGRARELGVLRALGVGAETLRRSLLFEGLLVGALAALLAVGLSVPMAHVLVGGLNRVAALAAPVVVPRGWIVAVPLLALAVGLLASLLPAARAARQDPADSVRYE
jgi:putative ABC transport system permease protein